MYKEKTMCSYVCDRNNHRIQVFDLDLNFLKSISSYHGKRDGSIDSTLILTDDTGNMFVAGLGNRKVLYSIRDLVNGGTT